MGDDVDISALTIEQYLALIQIDRGIRDHRSLPFPWRNSRCHYDQSISYYPQGAGVEERYNDPLSKCPHHDLNNHQKVQIFYIRLDISTRRMLDYRGFITLMTPTQALKSIQVKADHSHNWYDEATTRKKINDSLDNVDSIQERVNEKHLTKECPLKKEDKTVELRHLKEQIGSPYRTREPVCMIENPREVHKMKAQEDEGDMDVGWDITVEDVARLRQFLIPSIQTLPNRKPIVQPYMSLGPVHDKEKIIREEEQDYDIPLHDGMMQPSTRQTIHITPPDVDYVAPNTNLILDKQLNEFRKEFFLILLGFPKRQIVT
nr:hypothetical protein [Tanacetum cinerariifolium]